MVRVSCGASSLMSRVQSSSGVDSTVTLDGLAGQSEVMSRVVASGHRVSTDNTSGKVYVVGRQLPRCVLCKNHGVEQLTRGHKALCPRKHCNCDKCSSHRDRLKRRTCAMISRNVARFGSSCTGVLGNTASYGRSEIVSPDSSTCRADVQYRHNSAQQCSVRPRNGVVLLPTTTTSQLVSRPSATAAGSGHIRPSARVKWCHMTEPRPLAPSGTPLLPPERAGVEEGGGGGVLSHLLVHGRLAHLGCYLPTITPQQPQQQMGDVQVRLDGCSDAGDLDRPGHAGHVSCSEARDCCVEVTTNSSTDYAADTQHPPSPLSSSVECLSDAAHHNAMTSEGVEWSLCASTYCTTVMTDSAMMAQGIDTRHHLYNWLEQQVDSRVTSCVSSAPHLSTAQVPPTVCETNGALTPLLASSHDQQYLDEQHLIRRNLDPACENSRLATSRNLPDMLPLSTSLHAVDNYGSHHDNHVRRETDQVDRDVIMENVVDDGIRRLADVSVASPYASTEFLAELDRCLYSSSAAAAAAVTSRAEQTLALEQQAMMPHCAWSPRLDDVAQLPSFDSLRQSVMRPALSSAVATPTLSPGMSQTCVSPALTSRVNAALYRPLDVFSPYYQAGVVGAASPGHGALCTPPPPPRSFLHWPAPSTGWQGMWSPCDVMTGSRMAGDSLLSSTPMPHPQQQQQLGPASSFYSSPLPSSLQSPAALVSSGIRAVAESQYGPDACRNSLLSPAGFSNDWLHSSCVYCAANTPDAGAAAWRFSPHCSAECGVTQTSGAQVPSLASELGSSHSSVCVDSLPHWHGAAEYAGTSYSDCQVEQSDMPTPLDCSSPRSEATFPSAVPAAATANSWTMTAHPGADGDNYYLAIDAPAEQDAGAVSAAWRARDVPAEDTGGWYCGAGDGGAVMAGQSEVAAVSRSQSVERADSVVCLSVSSDNNDLQLHVEASADNSPRDSEGETTETAAGMVDNIGQYSSSSAVDEIVRKTAVEVLSSMQLLHHFQQQ